MNLRLFSIFLLIIIVAGLEISLTQDDSLQSRIKHSIDQTDGHIGVAVIDMENSDTVLINGNDRFPMQSVYKFPLALAVLRRVDDGTLSLRQTIHLTKEDLHPNTWSPLRDKYPNADVDVTLDEVLSATVSNSDNNACDILFRLIGGTGVVDKFVHDLGVKDIAIVATEEEMHRDWNTQYRNWSTPAAMAQLLCKFFRDSILSAGSREYLWQLMVRTTTGQRRIKGLLPDGTIVAHKTGLSDTNEKGITAATNDVGIIVLPRNKHLALAVFVSDSRADESTREHTIARIARAAWDVLTGR